MSAPGSGAYAVPLARQADGGQVYAIALNADETGLLMQSRLRNGLERALDIAFGRDDLALDALLDQRGLDGIALVRLEPRHEPARCARTGRDASSRSIPRC